MAQGERRKEFSRYEPLGRDQSKPCELDNNSPNEWSNLANPCVDFDLLRLVGFYEIERAK
jgi:hypothetical protein